MQLHELRTNGIQKNDTNGAHVDIGDRMVKYFRRKELPMHIDGFDCYYNKDGSSIVVTVWDKKTMVGKLDLDTVMFLGHTCYAVQQAGISKEYQGQGIGWALYQGLITLCGITLCSNGSHSKGAQKLWAELAADKKIATFAVDATEAYIAQPSAGQIRVPALKKSIYATQLAAILTSRSGKFAKKLTVLAQKKQTKPEPDVFGVKKAPYQWSLDRYY